MDRLVRLHRNPVAAVRPVADLNLAAEQVGAENPLLFVRLYVEFGAQHPYVAGERLDDERMLRVALDVEHRFARDLHPALSACKTAGYSSVVPELSHTVVPSVSVMLMRSPLGTNTLSELLEALRSNIFVAAK